MREMRARPGVLVGALVALLLMGLATACGDGPAPGGGAAGVADTQPAAAPSGPPVQPRGFHAVRDLPAASAPERLRIPSIGVDTGLDPLRRLPDGTLEVPPRWQVAGWWADGPTPGEPGPAAILGHVDSPTGPAVFARLRQLRAGDEVVVVAGTQDLRFRVVGSEQVPKNRFPTEQVYLPTLDPVLRLITCGGSFDRSTGHYTDNVIVSAALVS